eukprot:1885741-Pyramimonas_sp.AAC.2
MNDGGSSPMPLHWARVNPTGDGPSPSGRWGHTANWVLLRSGRQPTLLVLGGFVDFHGQRLANEIWGLDLRRVRWKLVADFPSW